MATPADLRAWISLLEREGELVHVTAEVDPYLEITEIVDRTVKAGGPALLFENTKGARHPLLINQFGTERRMCMAFGVDRLDDVAQKLVASAADLELIAADDNASVPALSGWRRELFGEDALALKHGRIGLTVAGRAVKIVASGHTAMRE